MNKRTKCLLCKETKENFSYVLTAKDLLLQTNFKSEMYKCNNCGVYFTLNIPSEDELLLYYPKSYSFYNELLNDVKFENMSFFGKIFYWFTLPIKDFIPKPKKSGETLLDIGAGVKTLNKGKKEGYKVFGIDISPFAVENARNSGFDCVQGNFEHYDFKERKFDIITMRHVLEHLIDPVSGLNKIYNILSDNGSLVLTLPNIRSFSWYFFKRYWYALDAPRHLWWFSPKSIKKLSRLTNFKLRKIRYVSFVNQFIGSFNFIFQSKNPVFKKIINSRVIYPLFFLFSMVLNMVRFGDIMEIHLEKNSS